MKKLNIEYHLLDKCNLNCKSCLHFSSLVKNDSPKDLDIIKKDFLKLYKITEQGKYIRRIGLMGGEPLLHNGINIIINYIGILFVKTQVNLELITNGLLLDKMDEEFFQIVKDYNIQISVSEYPIKFNYEKIYNLLRHKKVQWERYIRTKNDKIVFNVKYLQLEYDKNYIEKHKNCYMLSNSSLVDGKLYSCTIIAYFKYFDEQFKGQHNINITEDDYIDLDKINSYEELNIEKYKIPPFCGYCRGINNYTEEWGVTNKDIEEWVYKPK